MSKMSPSQLKETEVLQQFEDAKYQIVMAPFFGAMLSIKLRKLTEAQISECGGFSLIETFTDKIRIKNSKFDENDRLEYSKRMHKIVKKALVSPTYDQIFSIIGQDKISKVDEEFYNNLRSKLRSTPEGKERDILETRINNYQIWTNLILPNDFMATIVSYSLGVNESDIKEITEQMLLEAALLAEKGHDNPHDHISGSFTPFMQKDIDRRSWELLRLEREK